MTTVNNIKSEKLTNKNSLVNKIMHAEIAMHECLCEYVEAAEIEYNVKL